MSPEPPGRAGDHLAPTDGHGIDLAPVGILVALGDGQVIAANQAWSELSGLSQADSIGEGFLVALDPAELAGLQDDLRRAALGADRVVGDYHLADGSTRRRTRWWLRRQDGSSGPLVVMAVGDSTDDGGPQAGRHLPAGLPAEVADTLILRLNAVAFTLASCARIIDDQAAIRIGQAIADLDAVIHDLRAAPGQPDSPRPGEPGAGGW